MSRITSIVRTGLMIMFALTVPLTAKAAPFAAYVMDARTGQEIYSQNADTRLHPASLTKMMTLYLAFTAIERGQVRLDSKFLVSSHAAAQPPSRLGLKAGQRIELRYLIRAAAIKSANDAATAIGEGIAGSEEKFAAMMTATARAMGMRNTQFRNANGLTAEGHFSSAHDMSILGRRLFYDYPQYYNIFSRRSADAGIAKVASTNRRFLDAYEGADGIKTGYTRAAGFNLTASAQRGRKRIIATVMGGTSTAQRNEVMGQLLDAGFGKAPNRVREERPAAPVVVAEQKVRRVQVASLAPTPSRSQLSASDRPVARASTASVVTPAAIDAAVERAHAAADALDASSRPVRKPGAPMTASAKGSGEIVISAPRPEARPEEGDAPEQAPALSHSARPMPAPRDDRRASLAPPAEAIPAQTASLFASAALPSTSAVQKAAPRQPDDTVILAALEPETMTDAPAQIVLRGGGADRNWGVDLGLKASAYAAEQLLVKTALREDVGTASSQVVTTKRGYRATFAGMSQHAAQLTCQRLMAQQQECSVISR